MRREEIYCHQREIDVWYFSYRFIFVDPPGCIRWPFMFQKLDHITSDMTRKEVGSDIHTDIIIFIAMEKLSPIFSSSVMRKPSVQSVTLLLQPSMVSGYHGSIHIVVLQPRFLNLSQPQLRRMMWFLKLSSPPILSLSRAHAQQQAKLWHQSTPRQPPQVSLSAYLFRPTTTFMPLLEVGFGRRIITLHRDILKVSLFSTITEILTGLRGQAMAEHREWFLFFWGSGRDECISFWRISTP